MALADILRERVSRGGRSAQVDCGELGILTVEALPLRECAALASGPDGDRAVLYAACREMQMAGEELRQAGKLFTPDGITAYLSDGEARTAAQVVMALSGVSEKTDSQSGSDTDENRLEIVQNENTAEDEKSKDAGAEVRKPLGENRLEDVQINGTSVTGENRLDSVQEKIPGQTDAGQVSHEFFTNLEKTSERLKSDKKSQDFVFGQNNSPQNVPEAPWTRSQYPGTAAEGGETKHEIKSDFGDVQTETAHEIKSEIPVGLHEIESEIGADGTRAAHEIKSEIPERLHETESEIGADRTGAAHETKSEIPKRLHEIESEIGDDRTDTAHETKSEVPEGLHEITSETAEKIARMILEGLRRASQVR